VWNVLEGHFPLLLANPYHMHNIPGRKTDQKDSEWIADLLAHGLLRASFVPPRPVQELRDLTRYRVKLMGEYNRVHNRIAKVLEDANLKLGSGIADVAGLLDAGVRVVLGADGPPCNNRLSVFHEMSLAGTLPGLSRGPAALGAWAVLAMATREGAAALHLETEIGTLESGKSADLTVVDMDEWSMLPGGDPASRIVFGGSAQMVRHVVVAGRPVVLERRLVSGDPDGLRKRIAEVWTATQRRMESTS